MANMKLLTMSSIPCDNFYSFVVKKGVGGLGECIVRIKISYEVSDVKPSELGKC